MSRQSSRRRRTTLRRIGDDGLLQVPKMRRPARLTTFIGRIPDDSLRNVLVEQRIQRRRRLKRKEIPR